MWPRTSLAVLRFGSALVVLTMVLSGCTGETERLGRNQGHSSTQDEGWQAGDSVPTLSMSREDVIMTNTGAPAWRFTVTDVRQAPIPYSVVVIKIDGCAWKDQSERGNVEVSDTILCRSHDVLTLVHAPSGQRMYSNCNGCGTPLPPASTSTQSTSTGSNSYNEPWYVDLDFHIEDYEPLLRVTRVEAGHNWDELEAIATNRSRMTISNGHEEPHTRTLDTLWQPLEGSEIRVGDELRFCGLEPAPNYSFTLRGIGGSWTSGFTVHAVDPCTPNIAFTKQASQDRLQVVSADPDADWSDIRFDVKTGDCGDVTISTYGHQGSVADGSTVTMTAKAVGAGDYLQLQPIGGICEFALHHVPSDHQMGSWQFS